MYTKDEIAKVDLTHIYTNADKVIYLTQKELEHKTKQLAEAADIVAKIDSEYRQLVASETEAEYKKKTPITLISKIVEGRAADMRYNLGSAKGLESQLKAMCNSLQEQLQTIKFICRDVQKANKL